MYTGPAVPAFIGPHTALPPAAPPVLVDDEDNNTELIDEREILGEVKLAQMPVHNHPQDPQFLAQYLQIPTLPSLLCRFLYAQTHLDIDVELTNIPLDDCPDLPH
ncbi:hypothetical protein MVEN_02643600 [Mycena venus]|uniref:Uncharacterized protein n=1 Tax=Mycena venus TaxID=2733690 RepID=A0A8H6TW66_9AGAR|nr:hypothetical protein MVEN_02643600 [Mycena venus]